MKRIFLFLATNVAVLALLAVTMQLLGIQGILDEQGVNLDLGSLLVFSAVLGFGGSLISLAISKWSAKRMTGARVIDQPANDVEAWLVNTVKRHATQAGIGMPDVAVYDAPEPNAFATGARRDSALVAVSTGLLKSMRKEEVDAVLAHEVSHIANGDMVTMTLIQGVVNTFVIFLSRVVGFVVDRVVFRTERGFGPGYFITSIVAQILLGILASTIVMAFSRHREFRADEGGARLAGKENMISALQRLGGGQPAEMPAQLNGFGISGHVGQGIKRLFMSHPPIPERIEALRRAG
ncbi:MAG: protease HtpX [Gammaproteobacteria bacterium]